MYFDQFHRGIIHALENIGFLQMVVLSKRHFMVKSLLNWQKLKMTVKSFWVEILASKFHRFLVMM